MESLRGEKERSRRFVFVAVAALALLVTGICSAATLTADRLRGISVRSADGKTVGAVEEPLIDLERGRIRYLLVTDASAGRQVLIPWRALRLETNPPAVHLAIDAEKFARAPTRGEGGRIEEQTIHRYFGETPAWQNEPAAKPRPPRNLRIVR